MFWSKFQEDPSRAEYEFNCPVDQQQADKYTKQRVNHVVPCVNNDNRPSNNCQGCQGVADNVQICAFDIQVVMPMQFQGCPCINNKTDRCYYQDLSAFD